MIDHSPPVRARLVGRLVEAGLEVVADGTGDDAIALVRTTSPDGIVIDVLVPARDGLRLLEVVRGLAPRAVIIVLTNALYYRRPCLALGADHFLDKSTEFDAVAAKLGA